MIVYLDTSAFLKLYLQEDGADRVRELVAEARAVVCHAITYVEMRAALGRAVRQRRLKPRVLAEQLGRFESDWAQARVVAVHEQLLRLAGDLADEHGLRAYDSLHLAAVLEVARAFPSDVDFRFAVFDGELRRTADALGLVLVPEDA